MKYILRSLLFGLALLLGTAATLSLPLALTGCASQSATPQATMFATLRASAAGIDSFRASYEAAFDSGQITAADRARLDAAYNRANDAIIAAARALRAGMALSTPADVDLLVRELANLVTTIVPPKPR